MRLRASIICGIFLGAASVHAAPPSASLGAPQPASSTRPASHAFLQSPRPAPQPVIRGAAPDSDVLLGDRFEPRNPAATLGPIPGARPVTGISLAPNDEPLNAEERYNRGLPDEDNPFQPRRRSDGRYQTRTGWLDRWDNNNNAGDPIMGGHGNGGSAWQSDHDFDRFISPVTNPFLAEDPRKLTELRPIFQYQTIPDSNIFYRGGNIENFVLQGRLGLSENWSVVLHKLGVIVINPGSDGLLGNQTGLTEIWLGPKWTFWKDCETGTLAATGLIFQIPVGGGSAYQNTGNFGLVPYITGAQKFYKTSFGEFTVMDTLGYQFGFNDERSDFLYNSLHLDFDVANWSRIYPLLELNWFHYTSNGSGRPFFPFEAGDLGNVGAPVKGRDYLNLAIGARFKLSEPFQFGIATEFPLVGTRDLNNFRLNLDFIWRY